MLLIASLQTLQFIFLIYVDTRCKRAPEGGSTWKREKLKIVQEKLQVKVLKKVEKKAFLPKCPFCKIGNVHPIAVFDQRGPPAWYLGGSQNPIPRES